ncbi:YbaN family protein [Oscillospiraceae bacterium MB08-C2-2]|nr:YbaN family protein [Oscillospiraceae bacterium MB08-C2-2]
MLVGGLVFVGLGALGVVLPVLPTTPFLLLAAYCFSKSSIRFHRWLCSTHLYQKHMASYVNEQSMPLRTKLFILLWSSTAMIAAASMTSVILVRIILTIILIFHWWYFIFCIKTK